MKNLAIFCCVAFIAGCLNINATVPNPPPVNINTNGGSSGSGGGWGFDNSSAASEGGYQFIAFDTLAWPGEPVALAARLKTEGGDYVAGATVGFYRSGKLAGQAKTDSSGLATISVSPSSAGDYLYTAKVEEIPSGRAGSVEPAPLLLACRDRSAKLILIWANDTLLDGGFGDCLKGKGPSPSAASAAIAISGRYTFIYSVNREYLLHRKAKMWLADNGFPAGPILLDKSPGFADAGRFKNSDPASLKSNFSGLSAAIAKDDDRAQKYLDNALTAYWLHQWENKAKDMRKAAEKIRDFKHRQLLQVVNNWKDIQAAVCSGRDFSADSVADRLEDQAKKMQKN
ncbi:MAG: hypothetical protein HZA50_03895 [Planctomycetes bacterium]|nr:hypothetical protein [Planctomycetota bacterium]